MKEYKLDKKTVRINGQSYEGHFPEAHSKVKGVVYRVTNLNAWDKYANIANWHTTCFVLWKDREKWERIYDGPQEDFEINNQTVRTAAGLYEILFMLESERVRNGVLRKKEVADLRRERKKIDKKLEELL